MLSVLFYIIKNKINEEELRYIRMSFDTSQDFIFVLTDDLTEVNKVYRKFKKLINLLS